MKAYSQDLRQRVLRAIDAGANQAQVAETFAVSRATIKRYLKARRETGHVTPKAIPGRPAVKGVVLQAHLRAQLEAHPDVTREEHCRLFKATYGIEVSTASITRARQALNWTRKKSRS
jgi:transposase